MLGGVKGSLHTRDFKIVDLFYNNATAAKIILDNFQPVMIKKEYLEFMESVDKIETFEG